MMGLVPPTLVAVPQKRESHEVVAEVETKLDEWEPRRGIVREPLPSERQGRA